jgi:DNA invertase Pin-like site-specific DNA recombinase
MKRAAGYVRVSTPGQVDDESLTTQRKSITDFAKRQDS